MYSMRLTSGVNLREINSTDYSERDFLCLLQLKNKPASKNKHRTGNNNVNSDLFRNLVTTCQHSHSSHSAVGLLTKKPKIHCDSMSERPFS